MSTRPTRRRFLTASSLAASALAVPNVIRAMNPPPSEKLNLAVIGVADRGADNLAGVAHENVVALCDVDEPRAGKARGRFPDAAFFTDYRKLFDAVANRFDAVVVSTPDHSHCLPAAIALTLGKHVYCEKPLAHTVHETRLLRKLAAEKKLVTQMGTQIHAQENYRRVVEIVQAGLLGPVERVHVWLGSRPPAGKRVGTKPSAKFDIDLWLGPTPAEFFEAVHPDTPFKDKQWPHFHWRYWWEFGGGQLADFGCHFIDLPYWALGLTAPTSVSATGKKTYSGDNTVPDVLRVDYQFPAVGSRPPVHLTWYHGVPGPDLDGKETYRGYGSGVLFVGAKGKLVADYNKYTVLPEEFAKGFAPPPKSIPPSVGHHKEWTEAAKTGGKTTCHFGYSGLLTEAVLLGNVAYRAGKELTWDTATGKTNVPGAEQFLGKEYRKGWELPSAK
jgi:predicted dehydrogenase